MSLAADNSAPPVPDAQPPIPNDASYEQLAELLQAQVGMLERGDLTLAEALAAYERGVELVRRCGELLDGAQLRISTLSADAESAMNGESPTDGETAEWDPSDDDVPF